MIDETKTLTTETVGPLRKGKTIKTDEDGLKYRDLYATFKDGATRIVGRAMEQVSNAGPKAQRALAVRLREELNQKENMVEIPVPEALTWK